MIALETLKNVKQEIDFRLWACGEVKSESEHPKRLKRDVMGLCSLIKGILSV